MTGDSKLIWSSDSAYFPLLEGEDIFFGRYQKQISFADNSLFEWYDAGTPLQRLVLFLAYINYTCFTEVMSIKIGVCPYYLEELSPNLTWFNYSEGGDIRTHI